MNGDAPMVESAWSKRYKERLQEKKDKAAKVLKEYPDNKIAKEISAKANRNLQEKDGDSPEAKTWDFIDAAYYAARDVYMEGEATLDEAITELMEALGVCKQMAADKGESGKTKSPKGTKAEENKKLAETVGY